MTKFMNFQNRLNQIRDFLSLKSSLESVISTHKENGYVNFVPSFIQYLNNNHNNIIKDCKKIHQILDKNIYYISPGELYTYPRKCLFEKEILNFYIEWDKFISNFDNLHEYSEILEHIFKPLNKEEAIQRFGVYHSVFVLGHLSLLDPLKSYYLKHKNLNEYSVYIEKKIIYNQLNTHMAIGNINKKRL